MSIENLFAQARSAIAAGSREEGRGLLVAILRENPDFAPAWLWMSGVLDEADKRRECLERVLQLDPENAAAKQGLALLDMQEIAETVSPAPPQAKNTASAKRLGEYLVQQHFISQSQLDVALREQEQESRYGRIVPLGDILLRRRWLTAQGLTRALELQKEERAKDGGGPSNRLGEYLIQNHLISPKQLNEVIARQASLKRQGQNFQLGELLVLSGMLSRQQLQRAIDEQKQQFLRHFDQH
ncbi:MAG: hypothetical protein H0T53_09540 [Herpetosiphonaceae bacterium]|nr:hypothetical protein [Herpetosiphonaceae bacterium]